jgi:hypothetical protein
LFFSRLQTTNTQLNSAQLEPYIQENTIWQHCKMV